MISDKWRKECAQKVGLRGDLDYHTTRVGMTLHVPCEAGDHVVDVKVSKGMPPDAVAKVMIQKGWTIGSRLKCPDCTNRRKVKKKPGETANRIHAKSFEEALATAELLDHISPNIEATVKSNTPAPYSQPKELKLMSTPKSQGSSVVAVAASQEETRRRLKRNVIEWLGETYDEDKCCYKSGFSDASIAKETGAAEKFVAEIREDLYGPMGEPDDLRQLRADFAAHMESGKAWLAEHDRVAKTFYARLERLIIKNGWRTEA